MTLDAENYFGEAVQDLFGIGRFGAGFNAVTGPVQLQVPASDADEAFRLLQDLRGEEHSG